MWRSHLLTLGLEAGVMLATGGCGGAPDPNTDQTVLPELDSAVEYRLRAVSFAIFGGYDNALADYSEAIRLDPDDAETFNNRGDIWRVKGEYDKALADFNEALRLNPKLANAHGSLAWLLATRPDADYRDGTRAIAHATKACELTDWEDHIQIEALAVALAEVGDFGTAVKWQEKALSMCSDDEERGIQSRLELYKAGKPYRWKPRE